MLLFFSVYSLIWLFCSSEDHFAGSVSFYLNIVICMQVWIATSQSHQGQTCFWFDGLCVCVGLFLLTAFIIQPNSISLLDNKWRTDKVSFYCLLSLINMLAGLAEQSYRRNESCRISGASKWVSCADRKWGLLWGQCIDFLPCRVWECSEKSSFLLRRMPCQLSHFISSQLLRWEIVNVIVL